MNLTIIETVWTLGKLQNGYELRFCWAVPYTVLCCRFISIWIAWLNDWTETVLVVFSSRGYWCPINVFLQTLFQGWSTTLYYRVFTNVESTLVNGRFLHVESTLILWPQRCFDVDKLTLIQLAFWTIFQRLTNVGVGWNNVVSTFNRRHLTRWIADLIFSISQDLQHFSILQDVKRNWRKASICSQVPEGKSTFHYHCEQTQHWKSCMFFNVRP